MPATAHWHNDNTNQEFSAGTAIFNRITIQITICKFSNLFPNCVWPPGGDVRCTVQIECRERDGKAAAGECKRPRRLKRSRLQVFSLLYRRQHMDDGNDDNVGNDGNDDNDGMRRNDCLIQNRHTYDGLLHRFVCVSHFSVLNAVFAVIL